MTGRKGLHLLNHRMSTGDKGRDRQLNERGTVLAALLVFGARWIDRDQPLTIPEMRADFAKLATCGIGPQTGPGDRLEPSDDAIREALKFFGTLVPLGKRRLEEDGRVIGYTLDGAWPEIVIREPVFDPIGTWELLRHAALVFLEGGEGRIVGLGAALRE